MSNLVQLQKLSQKILPQQILVSKLLEVSSYSLPEIIEKEIEENSALEQDPQRTEYGDSVDEFKANYSQYRSKSDQLLYETALETQSEKKNLYELLLEQLDFLDLSERDKFIAEYVIVNLEKDGYLRVSIQNLSNTLLYDENFEVDISEIEVAINLIKKLDPNGVGSRDLKEFFLLQIGNLEIDEKLKYNCYKIIDSLPDNFEYSRNLELELSKHCDIDFGLAKEIMKSLKIVPYEDTSPLQKNTEIHIDFLITIENNEVVAKLVDNYLPVRVNQLYLNYLKKEKKNQNSEETIFLQNRIKKAEFFIDALTQREITFEKVIKSILFFQYDFFFHEDKSFLKPLTLKNVAEKSGLDISTVSRVVNKKYVKTDFGVFSLKEFFSSSLHSDKGDVSSNQVKNKIKDIIYNENKLSPLSDYDIAEKLNEEGYIIARRTVAKYRESMGISPSTLRNKKNE